MEAVNSAQETASQVGIDPLPFQQAAAEVQRQIVTETASLPEGHNPNIVEMAETGGALLPGILVVAVLAYKLRRGMHHPKAQAVSNSYFGVM